MNPPYPTRASEMGSACDVDVRLLSDLLFQPLRPRMLQGGMSHAGACACGAAGAALCLVCCALTLHL